MPQPEFQCPFCEQTSSRPQGLAAHIRSRHPKQYPKWLKTPTRLADAEKSTTNADRASTNMHGTEPSPEPVHSEPTISRRAAADGNPAFDLLKKAHGQLLERKQNIETELARLNGLTKELDSVNAQIQALDNTLEVFASQPTS